MFYIIFFNDNRQSSGCFPELFLLKIIYKKAAYYAALKTEL